MGRRSTIALLTGTLAAACGGPASAELTYGVEAGAGRSDNITRVADDEVSETLATAGVNLEWHETRPRLRADISADADYVKYLDDTYEAEVIGGLNGTLDFALLPERLSWIFQDSFGQQATDPFAPQTPDTRENVNYFTTGPTLQFPIGTRAARIFATYSLTDYENSPLDSERLVGGVSFGPRGLEGRGLGINAVTEQVKFDDDINTDFDRDSVYVSYRLSGSRTRISAEAGYSWLELEGAADKSGDPRISLEVERDLTDSSMLVLNLGTQLTDSSDALRSTLFTGPPGGAGGGINATSDPFRNRSVSLYWNFNKRRTSLSIGGSLNDDEYETATFLDRRRTVWSVSVGRQTSSRLNIGLTGNYTDEKFDLNGQQTRLLDLGATADWRLGQSTTLNLSLLRSDRDVNVGLGDYTENRVMLRLIWSGGDPTGGRAR